MQIDRILNNQYLNNDGNHLSFDFRKYFQRSMEIYYDGGLRQNVTTSDDCYNLSYLAEKLSLYLKLNFEVAEHPIFFTYRNEDFYFDVSIDDEDVQRAKRSLIGTVQTIFKGTDFVALITWKITDDSKFVPVIRGFCFSQRDVLKISGVQQKNINGILNFYEVPDLVNTVLLTFADSLDISQFWSFFERDDWNYGSFQPISAECFGHKAVTNFIKKNGDICYQ